MIRLLVTLVLATLVLSAGCLAAPGDPTPPPAPMFTADESRPADAIVLFDGKDFSQWVKCGSADAPGWKIENGYTEVVPGAGDICTKQRFKDCQLHVEFWIPLMRGESGQARGNSGVFFEGFVYEIQVLDSYKLKSARGDCGAVYSIFPPMVNACRPPEQWQSYDIIFHAPKFDESGKKTANARVTVLQNGVMVHDNVDIPHATPDAGIQEPKDGPIELQDHHCKVRYRNVWIRPLQ